jgi:hypothetical protein
MKINYCWLGSSEKLLAISNDTWLEEMKKNYALMFPNKNREDDPSDSQIEAWKDSLNVLKDTLRSESPTRKKLTFISEYYLPRENGRRPDVIVLSGSKLLVLEFKMKGKALFIDIDQAADYKRDIQNYHEPSQVMTVESVLMLSQLSNHYVEGNRRGIIEASPDYLGHILDTYFSEDQEISSEGLENWINGGFRPLPTIIDAAQRMFRDGDIPNIRNAKVKNFENITTYIDQVIEKTKAHNEKAILFVTGIPGAGKTYLGLKYAYDLYKDEGQRTTFLSGNGPLVKVLQKALDSRALVRSQKSFVQAYTYGKSNETKEKIIVLDEAQRLWDADYVYKKHGHRKSEPEILLDIAQNIKGWGLIIALIGTGQEIYLGEEGGMDLWYDAISKLDDQWHVYAPSGIFKESINNGQMAEVLNLDVSLRSHLAENVHMWVEKLLEGQHEDAYHLSRTFHEDYPIYVLRDISMARGYCKHKYKDAINKTYGLIASSKSFMLPKYGVDNSYNGSQLIEIDDWYLEKRSHKNSAMSFNHVATEFSCQGLELDFPIVCWEKDFIFNKGKWHVDSSVRTKLKDRHKITRNVYRVLLTRGRDGMTIFIPDDRSLDSTYDLLIKCGGIPVGG